jgi:hypothetical protein
VIAMQTIQSGYRSVQLLLSLNVDRILIPAAIVVGLIGGALIGAELAALQVPPAPSVF